MNFTAGGGTKSLSVKRLIRSKTTKRFLTKEGGWGDDFSKARTFDDSSEVQETRARLNLLDVETYYSFDETKPSEFDFALPLFAGDDQEAGFDRSRRGSFRILLRQGQEYLQPSGEWNKARATAREFASSLLAYWWAKEKQLLGVEVVMVYADGQPDFVPMRV